MTDTKSKIIQAAFSAFKRYSIQRTTMADIASEAGLSRQTLYSTLGSKEEVVAEVVAYAEMQGIQNVKARLVECKSLCEQMDVYIEERVIIPFEHIQKDPFTLGIWGTAEIKDHSAVLHAKQVDFQFLSELFLPYTVKLGEAGLSPAEIAHYIIYVCTSLKTSPISREKLNSLVPTLKTTILTMALGRDPR